MKRASRSDAPSDLKKPNRLLRQVRRSRVFQKFTQKSHPTTSNSGTRLTSTYELLEHILLYLPLRDLLFAQRVNTNFKNVINDSRKIKKALWLTPARRETVKWYADTPSSHDSTSTGNGRWKVSGKAGAEILITNPFIACLKKVEIERLNSWARWRRPLLFTLHERPPRGSLVIDLGPWSRSERGGPSSLSKMFLTSPSARELVVSERIFLPPISDEAEVRGRSTITNANGVRISDCVDKFTQGRERKGFVEVIIDRSKAWEILDLSVNKITGWEMLDWLEADSTKMKRMREALRKRKYSTTERIERPD